MTPPDIRDQPAYPVAEVARYLRLPASTLHAWLRVRSAPESSESSHYRLITPVSTAPLYLSFWNLVEAHVLMGLRINNRLSVRALYEAIEFVETTLRVSRVLLRSDLLSGAGEMLLNRYCLSRSFSACDHDALRACFATHLDQIEWDESGLAMRFNPTRSGSVGGLITIDPEIAFGSPTIKGTGIRTEVIAERVNAGESLSAIEEDYGLKANEALTAIAFGAGLKPAQLLASRPKEG